MYVCMYVGEGGVTILYADLYGGGTARCQGEVYDSLLGWYRCAHTSCMWCWGDGVGCLLVGKRWIGGCGGEVG